MLPGGICDHSHCGAWGTERRKQQEDGSKGGSQGGKPSPAGFSGTFPWSQREWKGDKSLSVHLLTMFPFDSGSCAWHVPKEDHNNPGP